MNTVKFQAKKYNQIRSGAGSSSRVDLPSMIDETGEPEMELTLKDTTQIWIQSLIRIQSWTQHDLMSDTDETGARDGVDSQRYNTNMDPELDQDPELNPMI